MACSFRVVCLSVVFVCFVVGFVVDSRISPNRVTLFKTLQGGCSGIALFNVISKPPVHAGAFHHCFRRGRVGEIGGENAVGCVALAPGSAALDVANMPVVCGCLSTVLRLQCTIGELTFSGGVGVGQNSRRGTGNVGMGSGFWLVPWSSWTEAWVMIVLCAASTVEPCTSVRIGEHVVLGDTTTTSEVCGCLSAVLRFQCGVGVGRDS